MLCSAARPVGDNNSITGGKTMSVGKEFKVGWPAVLAAFVGILTGAQGLIYAALPQFMPALEEEFGWSRTAISGGATLFMLTMFVTVPFAGAYCDRHGVRRTLFPSIVFGAICIGAMSLIQSQIWTYFVGLMIIAVVGAATNAVIYSRALVTWFDKSRGLAFGIMMTGAGFTQALVAPGVATLVEAYGWRTAWIGLGALGMLALPVCFWLLHERRAPASSAASVAAQSGLSLAEAARTRQFWAILAGTILLVGSVAGVAFHLRVMLSDTGMPAVMAASMAGLVGVGTIVSRLGAGFLVDRFHGPFVAAGVFALAGIGCATLYLFGVQSAVISAVLVGVALGGEAELLGYLASRYFGLKSYSTIYGICYSSLALGAGASPMLYGYIHDQTGDYQLALLIGVFGTIGAVLLYGTLGKYRFEPKEIGAEG
jgi:MFS family permease